MGRPQQTVLNGFIDPDSLRGDGSIANPLRTAADSPGTSEFVYWQQQAAMLDPLSYVLADTAVGALDVTVPAGQTWFAVNAYQVYYNDPTFFATDGFPNTRPSGFIRPLDIRRAMAMPAGTRIRNNTISVVAYVFYCNPSLVIATDPRYSSNPRELYFSRLARLQTLPIRELVLEAQGGGGINDVVDIAIPADFDNGIVIGASVYDCCWANFGLLNVMNEMNNTHIIRNAETLFCPFRRLGIGGTRFTMKKGTPADGWSLNPYGDPYSQFDAAVAFPFTGSANVLYQVTPADW
jgi:hypothetical protein